MVNNCIAVLTRGYNNTEQYSTLIKRNKHISVNLNDKTIDILIFHEGNITSEQQIFIINQTPELKIEFINILDIAFQNDKNNIIVEEAPQFGLGYRHMCSFWFINFFNVVKKYDNLLRIDEDCFINSNIDNLFLELNKYIFICGKISGDCDFVTKGLNLFSLDFLKKYENNYTFKNKNPRGPCGPYTNLIGFSLKKINNNDAFKQYIDDLDKSDMIYKRRWGDLPLWGEVICYIFGDETLKVDNTIKYFHGSHNTYVN